MLLLILIISAFQYFYLIVTDYFVRQKCIIVTRTKFYKEVLNNDKQVEDPLGVAPLAKIEYPYLRAVVPLEASLPHFLQRTNRMFLCSDINYYVPVGNRQTPLLGYLPVQSKMGRPCLLENYP